MTSITMIDAQAEPMRQPGRYVLLVGFDETSVTTLSERLAGAGWGTHAVRDRTGALGAIASDLPALVLWQAAAGDRDVQAAGRELRRDPATRDLAVLVVGARSRRAHRRLDGVVSTVLGHLATLPGDARLPSDPVDDLGRGLLGVRDFERVLLGDLNAASAGPRASGLAVVDVRERHWAATGSQESRELFTRVVEAARADSSSLETLGVDDDGRLLVLLRDRDPLWVAHRLHRISEQISGRDVHGRARLTPVVGWTALEHAQDHRLALSRAHTAWAAASAHLDLEPVRWTPALEPGRPRQGLLGRLHAGRSYGAVALVCAALTVVLGVALPFAVLVAGARRGIDLAPYVHAVVTVALVVTAASIWIEGFASLRRRALPPESSQPAPPATAIIAAYLPNEAATIVETVEHFLGIDYPDLQVVLAYNRPEPLPVEAELAEIARRDPRLVVLPVTGSTSKAQNVNAALAVARGTFVGVFDADHHPARDAFRRARRWLDAGHDVVQGRCVVRNGDDGLVAGTVAVEFESIYGVSHPGRARLHGFAIFGGSNGYWRTETLHETRLRSRMLTEDIDSSVRLVLDGGRIVCDPGLVSRELAPTGLGALWRQRLRWAQGWFQVSRGYRGQVRDNPTLSVRQKAGLMFLLRWRELNPWLTQLIVPLTAYRLWQADWSVPALWQSDLVLLATLFTLSTAPGQALFAWHAATPELRRRPWWFVRYLLVGSLAYTEWKNLTARVGQLLEVFGVRTWVVTPRA